MKLKGPVAGRRIARRWGVYEAPRTTTPSARDWALRSGFSRAGLPAREKPGHRCEGGGRALERGGNRLRGPFLGTQACFRLERAYY